MVKRIDVMNVELDNYSMREAMTLVETFLNNTVLNTIEEVSLRMIMQAEDDLVVRECIRGLDIAVPGEKEIFAGTDINGGETMHNHFFYEFAKRAMRNKKTVLLLGKTLEDVEALKTFLEQGYDRLQVIGSCYLDQYADYAGVINEINIQAPDVVLSVIPSPIQEHFLMEEKERLHAKVWYGMNNSYLLHTRSSKMKRMARSIIGKIHFRRLISDFHRNE